MNAVVVFESMYGNTHQVADAIGRGLAGGGAVTVVPVERATPELLAPADLVVVGGPTHVHGMSRESTRRAAVQDAGNPDKHLVLDPDAEGEGLREWFDHLDELSAVGAAFDTRIDMSAVVTGRASKGIAKRLQKHGVPLLQGPMSFLVQKDNMLGQGQLERAEQWGRELRRALADHQATAAHSGS
jgi:hypothetical protein